MIAVVDSLERALAQAMLSSDVAALDRLLHDDLVFTSHEGASLTKADDLALHRSGLLTLSLLHGERQALKLVGNVVTVVVRATLRGSYSGTPFGGVFVYTRVWLLDGDRGQIVAAHCTALP